MSEKMRYPTKKKITAFLILLTVICVLLHPYMYGRINYTFISKEFISENLHEELASNFLNDANITCEYDEVIYDESTWSWSLNIIDEHLHTIHGWRLGGEYYPDCRPKFSTAIIVPYRTKLVHLEAFLMFMHTFLRQQYIHYRVYVVEQLDSLPFNRAKLLNIGAKTAIQAGFPCLIFHDVDLLPLKLANIYACTKNPRHMSSNLNTFRFIFPYINLCGGVIAIRSTQFQDINGMSNEFFDWDGEDDDMYSRLEALNLKPYRFEPAISMYQMLLHKSQKRGERRKKLLLNTKERMKTDGLNSLKYVEVSIVLHRLFTHVTVDLLPLTINETVKNTPMIL